MHKARVQQMLNIETSLLIGNHAMAR